MRDIQETVTAAWDFKVGSNDFTLTTIDVQAIEETIDLLATGRVRVAQKEQGTWVVNNWVKQAILLYFSLQSKQSVKTDFTCYQDVVPSAFSKDFINATTRIVPPAYIRHGAFVGDKTVVMPSFINIGAYVGSNCMIDTWATVGSCAQIGNGVHLSGGAGIGGVLEPVQANPTIIEDDCFIGARSEVVEGVIVEQNSVIAMGVFLGQSTKIFNRMTGSISYGRIPANSVVVPGTLPSSCGQCQLNAAIIVKQVDDRVKSKVMLNELLHDL